MVSIRLGMKAFLSPNEHSGEDLITNFLDQMYIFYCWYVWVSAGVWSIFLPIDSLRCGCIEPYWMLQKNPSLSHYKR